MGNWLQKLVNLWHHIDSKAQEIEGNMTSDAQLLILLQMEMS